MLRMPGASDLDKSRINQSRQEDKKKTFAAFKGGLSKAFKRKAEEG